MKRVPASITAGFDQATTRYGDKCALVADGQEQTYAQLAARAEGIGSWLLARGIGPGKTVGLSAQRSPDAIAAILGILKAGAAYLPLDPAYPKKLLRYIYEDSKPAAMLVQGGVPAEDRFWSG